MDPVDAIVQRRGTRAVGIVGVLALYALNAQSSWGTLVDDAFISLRFASVAAAGHGLRYSPDGPAVEGFTNLLWVLALTLGELAAVPAPWLLEGLSFLCGALGVGAAVALVDALRGKADALSLLPAAWLAILPHYGVVATNGLESALWTAALMGLPALMLREEGRRIGALGLGLLGLIRPEGFALALLWFGWEALARPEARAGLPKLVAPTVAIAALVELWRAWTYGALVPNTLAAKSELAFWPRTLANVDYLRPDAALWGLAAVLLACALLPLGDRGRRWPVLGGAAFVAALVFAVLDWMPGARLMVPAVALLACAAGASLAALPGRLGLVALAAMTVGVGAVTATLHRSVLARDQAHTAAVPNDAARAAAHLRAHLPPGAWCAVRDAGVFAYYLGPKVNVAELHRRALTLPHPGGADADVLGYAPVDPDCLVVTQSDERNVGFKYPNDRSAWLRTTLRYDYLGRVHQHYHRYYDVFVQSQLGVPPLEPERVTNRLGIKDRAGQ